MSAAKVTALSSNCIDLLNKQINKELCASYGYQALAIYFGKHNIALQNVANFFKHASDEEREHADKFIAYIQLRGGEVVLQDIIQPDITASPTLKEAFTFALSWEKDVYNNILKLHTMAGEKDEAHLASFLEDQFLDEQVQEEDKYVRLINIIDRMGQGLGEQLFDKDIISQYD